METRQPQTKTQNIGDTDLQYLHYEGPEPAIVLLHATGFLPWLWHPIAVKLSKTNRVIAPYFCDHRESELERGGLGWVTLAEDLAALCHGLNLEKPFLVGHSMGATVMTFAEAGYGLGASGMILIEPIFFPEHYYHADVRVEDHPLAVKSLKRRNRWKNAREVKAYLKSKPLFARWKEEFLDLYIQHGTVERASSGLELTCAPQREAALFMGGMPYDPWPVIPKVQCPVLIVEGENSGNRAFIDLAAAAARFKNGRLVTIAGAGHLIPMEMPDEVLAAIRDFVAGGLEAPFAGGASG
ncbi:MAG: alpha/beta hydrolase [Desulfosarcinaceae bacterium]